jgi:hypothetical protein
MRHSEAALPIEPQVSAFPARATGRKPVPVVSMKETLDRAFTERNSVAAFNILNDLTSRPSSPGPWRRRLR